jgi:tRNA U34 2-thiouridine synthase MnmA/TrmU
MFIMDIPYGYRAYLAETKVKSAMDAFNRTAKTVPIWMKKPKALGLLSGGLDSTLAVKLILDQGIDVEAVNFVSPFCLCGKGGCGAAEAARKLSVPLKVINVGEDYLRIVRRPRYGYGKNMNPCVDCRIFMLKKAKKYAEEIGAAFLFTGEVLDQRPMSQHRKTLELIEEEAGLKGKILRPLSAKLLDETELETRGVVDRKKLLDIKGRSRRKQIEIAGEMGLKEYPCPAGGCLLTYREFASKVRDLFDHKKRVSLKDIALLKVGRHFRHGENKIIVGRDERENKILIQLREKRDYSFEAKGCGSPVTLLQGPKTKKAVEEAARLTAYYSDQKTGRVEVRYGKKEMEKSLTVFLPNASEVDKLRLRGHGAGLRYSKARTQ